MGWGGGGGGGPEKQAKNDDNCNVKEWLRTPLVVKACGGWGQKAVIFVHLSKEPSGQFALAIILMR